MPQDVDLLGLGLRRDSENRFGGACKRRLFGLDEPVDADHGLLAALDRLHAQRVRFHQLALHVALLHGGNRSAQRHDMGSSSLAWRLSSSTLAAIAGEPSNMSPYSSRSVS